MSRDSLLKSLINLDNAFGVSGDEEDVAEVLRKEMEGLYDETLEDPLGNQFFIKYGRNREKKVLISAHMDESAILLTILRTMVF